MKDVSIKHFLGLGLRCSLVMAFRKAQDIYSTVRTNYL